MKSNFYMFLYILYANNFLYSGAVMKIHNVVTFMQKIALKEDSSVLDRAIALSVTKMYYKDKIKLDEVSKMHYCSVLTKYLANGQLHSSEELYFTHNAFLYLSCGSINLDVQELKKLVARTDSLFMLNYLAKLGALHNISVEKFISKSSLSEYITEDLPEAEKLQLSRIKCLIGGNERDDATKFLESLIKQYDGLSNLNITDMQSRSLFLITLLDCKIESLFNDEKMALFIEHMDSKFNFNILSKCWDTLEIFDRLIKTDSFVYLQSYASKYFQVLENSKILNFDVRDILSNSLLPLHISLRLESIKCGDKQVKSALTPHINTNHFSLSVDSNFDECLFVLRVSSSKPKVHVLRPIINLKASTPKIIKVIDVSIDFIDSSNEYSTKTKQVTFGSNISNIFKGDIIKFKIEFTITHLNTRIKPHQVFLNFHHKSLNYHSSLIAESDQNGRYTCNLNAVEHGNKTFSYLSGSYKMELVIGDFSFPDVITWYMGEIQLEFKKPATFTGSFFDKKNLPELQNYPKILFKNPPFIISLTFTCLIGFMLLIQFFIWSKVGLKISFKLSVARILFYLSFSGVFIMCFLYWTKFNGFEALPYYFLAGVIACLSLNYVLTPKCQV